MFFLYPLLLLLKTVQASSAVCLGVCRYKSSPVIKGDRSGAGLPSTLLRVTAWTCVVSLGVVCVVPTAQGVSRYNECLRLLYLGQLRKASNATITSVRARKSSLKLVTYWLRKLTLATKGSVARKTWLLCLAMHLPKWHSGVLWQAGLLFGSVSNSFPSLIFLLGICPHICTQQHVWLRRSRPAAVSSRPLQNQKQALATVVMSFSAG